MLETRSAEEFDDLTESRDRLMRGLAAEDFIDVADVVLLLDHTMSIGRACVYHVATLQVGTKSGRTV